MNPGGDVDTSLERLRGTSTSKDVGSGGMSEASVEAVATCDYENSEHSGEDVDDGVSSTFSRGSLLAGEFTFAIPSNRTPAAIVPASAGAGRSEGSGGEGGGGIVESNGGVLDAANSGGGVDGIGSGSGDLEEYKLGGDGDDDMSMTADDGRRTVNEDVDSSLRSTDSLIGSSFLNNYGGNATGDGTDVSVRRGRARGRGRGGPRHPRIRPTLERGASPISTPRNLPRAASGDDSGLRGAEFLSSPGGTRLLDACRSPLSDTSASGSEMTEAGDKCSIDIKTVGYFFGRGGFEAGACDWPRTCPEILLVRCSIVVVRLECDALLLFPALLFVMTSVFVPVHRLAGYPCIIAAAGTVMLSAIHLPDYIMFQDRCAEDLSFHGPPLTPSLPCQELAAAASSLGLVLFEKYY